MQPRPLLVSLLVVVGAVVVAGQANATAPPSVPGAPTPVPPSNGLSIEIEEAEAPDSGLDRIPRTGIYAAAAAIALSILIYLDRCGGTIQTRPRQFKASDAELKSLSISHRGVIVSGSSAPGTGQGVAAPMLKKAADAVLVPPPASAKAAAAPPKQTGPPKPAGKKPAAKPVQSGAMDLDLEFL
jgi:hypothetical protein